MKLSTILKLNFMVLGLGLTIYLIYSLNTKGLSPAAKLVLGLEGQSGAKKPKKLDWCETRVTGMILPEKFKVTQKGHQWILENHVQKVLNFIAVEKWLASACAVKAEPLQAGTTEGFLPALIVKYVNGQVEMIKQNAEGVFLWRDQAFKSPEFNQAIENLGHLPADKAASPAAISNGD